MAQRIVCFSFTVLFCLLVVSPGFSQPSTILLDQIPKETIAKFDRAHAIPNNSVLISSIQNNAVIPKNYLYPVIEWQKPDNHDGPFWLEIKSSNNELNLLLKKNRWQPDKNEFQKFLKDRELWITLYFMDKGRTCKTQSVGLLISERSLDDRIAFRIVSPLFDPALPNSISIFSFNQKLPDSLMELDKSCVGCHGYSAHLAYFSIKKGITRRLVTATQEQQEFRLNQLPRLANREFSFFAVAPNGKHAAVVVDAFGALKTRTTVTEPFDLSYHRGDIHHYDIEKGVLTPLHGASDPKFIEDMPFFSPDGKYLIFSRYQATVKEGIPLINSMDLYKIPFNEGKGGDPIPIKNLSSDHKYRYFPRYSPNGKWISFCVGDATRGVYARKTSDIYLLSSDETKLSRLSLNRDDTMDSWHDWSPDSHWLIFSSNREKNRLTALYLVYIDENGKDYPPVKLVGYETMKINTPQFVPKNLKLEALRSLNLRGYIDNLYAPMK